ncbi:MAG: formyltransferase family protein [Cyclobacteriaceae bacterium]
MKIQFLVDNPNSWINEYVAEWAKEFRADFINDHSRIQKGDILILLSCERKLEKRALNKFNLVVHESDLPEGKGWSPLTWQVLEGRNKLTVSLIEAEEKIDAGAIYFQEKIQLNGHELIPELREKQAEATFALLKKFIRQYPNITSRPQVGKESFYPKRRQADSELDISKTLDSQFNLLRVCDNDRYPAFFVKNGVKYLLKIEKDERH